MHLKRAYFVIVLAIGGWVHADSLRCETELAVVAKDYPTANFASCRVLAPDSFELAIRPEDEPINPSPWYGFRIERTTDEETAIKVTLKYESAPHRYYPKYSIDKKQWKPLEEHMIEYIDEYQTILTIPLKVRELYISAQVLLDQAAYKRWYENLIASYPFLTGKTIGYSVAKRPIESFAVNTQADRIIVLLGRQHPPEIPGSIAFMAFVEELLELKVNAYADANGSEVLHRFFDDHMIVFVPLLNPDGVQGGHWRNNLQGIDLNRDWFEQATPEIQAVISFIAGLEEQGKRPVLHLDFHSTRRDVLYTQMPDDVTDPPQFATKWLNFVAERGHVSLPEHAPRPLTEQGTAKGYFFKTYGIPSITYEVGDESDLEEVTKTAREFALATAVLYGEALTDHDDEPSPYCEALFCHMVTANGASLIMLDEIGLLDAELASRIAKAQVAYKRTADENGWPAGQNYLTLEEHLIETLGAEASNVHVGRSRQDLHGIARRMLIRQKTLDLYPSLIQVRKTLLKAATDHSDVVIPAYTHGVPSQPTTFGHLMLAFESAFARDTRRLQDAYARLNVSQLGVAAGSGSGFELHRDRMAELLGFDGIVANTFDANFLSTADYKLELAAVLAQGTATVTKFVENVHAQQRNPRPWLYLGEALTSGSSIMPQKRNPRELDRIRRTAAEVLAGASLQNLLNHNVDTGMHDYRDAAPLVEVLETAKSMYDRFATLVGHVHVDPELALAELNKGFSTSTEIADTLYRETRLAFRVSHEFAKQLVEHARATSQPLADLSNRDIQRIYREVAGESLPLDVGVIRDAMNPQHFIALRSMQGGPAPDAVLDALPQRHGEVERDARWLKTRLVQVFQAERRLNFEVQKLATR